MIFFEDFFLPCFRIRYARTLDVTLVLSSLSQTWTASKDPAMPLTRLRTSSQTSRKLRIFPWISSKAPNNGQRMSSMMLNLWIRMFHFQLLYQQQWCFANIPKPIFCYLPTWGTVAKAKASRRRHLFRIQTFLRCVCWTLRRHWYNLHCRWSCKCQS